MSRIRKHKDAGFTLVEILSVLVVVGLMSSAVVMTLPKPKSALDKQAVLLTAHLNALAQDGLIAGQVTAAGFSTEGYKLYSFTNGLWAERYAGHWSEPYRLHFKRADTKVKLTKEISPSLVFQPTGLSTPFEFTLEDRRAKYALMTSGSGRVEMKKTLQ